jgi:hypothetical protein
MAVLAALVWLGADIAIVGGWLATVGLVRRRHSRQIMLQLGLSSAGSSAGIASLRSARPRSPLCAADHGFATRRRRRGR